MSIQSAILKTRAVFNHGLARADARELVSHLQPIRKRYTPLASLGLGTAVVGYNLSKAPDAGSKKKVLIRDLLVMAGSLGGVLLGLKLMKPHHHWHHAKTAVERLITLMKPPLHDHGLEGGAKLIGLALSGIGGGVAAGLLADALNGEDVRYTATMKLKEGLFQLIGNIAFCTISILSLSKIGAKLGRGAAAIAKNKANKSLDSFLQKLKTYVEKAGTRQSPDYRPAIPSVFTKELEMVLQRTRHGQLHDTAEERLRKMLSTYAPNLSENGQDATIARTKDLLAKGQLREIEQHWHGLLGRQFLDDVAVLPKSSPAEFFELAAQRMENQGKLVGVLAGLATGIVGGAYASNQVNAHLTKAFNLPEGHQSGHLFSSNGDGLGAGMLGERGLHWWDGILHLDDWPSALYLAGVECLESMIGLLYGISGYLAGTAGTDYSRNQNQRPQPQTHLYMANQQPLKRYQGGYQTFIR